MEFSDNATQWLKDLGNFGPTDKGDQIKGWGLMGDEYERVYYNASDLRKLAEAAIEIADKLDSAAT